MSETEGHRLPVQDKTAKTFIGSIRIKVISPLQKAIEQVWGNRLTYLEVSIIWFWVVCLTFNLFGFNPKFVPAGREYFLLLQSNYIWTLLPKCGTCMFWNGFMNGGVPSFVEIHGNSMHPLTILSTLLFGVTNGGKALIIGSIFMAAMAQWWLAKVMGLRRITRVWSACLVAAGGHLAGRMEIGNVGMVLSTASAGLVLAAFIDFVTNKEKRSPAIFALSLTLLIFSGQGYMQLGIGFLLLFSIIFFFFGSGESVIVYLKRYLWVGILAILLAGYFIIPFIHFLPNFIKDTDPYLSQIQPMEYSPLNLVVKDIDFYRTEVLGKTSFPYSYNIFIGWVPVLFAGAAIRLVSPRKKQLLIYFLLALGLVFLVSGKQFYQVLQKLFPSIVMIRNASLIAGLAVPILVALAAWGVDLILNQDWGRVAFIRNGNPRANISISWIIIPTLLGLSLLQVYQFNRTFLYQVRLDVPQDAVRSLITPSTQWIQPPFGEFFWVDDIFSREMKIAHAFRPWRWDLREVPPAYRELSRNPEIKESLGYVEEIDGMMLLEFTDHQYASIETTDGVHIPCSATAIGGKIDVVCDSKDGGVLTVMENNYSGWKVWINGQKSRNLYGNWLSVDLSAGHNRVSFRYRPWDVLLGLLMTFSGIVLGAWLSTESGKRYLEKSNP